MKLVSFSFLTWAALGVDWLPKLSDYEQCILDGRIVDMHAAVSSTDLPPCVDVCTESPGVALSYTTYCGRSIDYQSESQISFSVRWSCVSVDNVAIAGCEWSTDETADLTLTRYLGVLVVLIAQSLSLPPNDVHCGVLWFGPSDATETVSGLFNLRVDESFWDTVFNEAFPYINMSDQTTLGGYDIFMTCRIDTYRLQQGSVAAPLAAVLTDLNLNLVGPIRYNVNSTKQLSKIDDSNYSTKYDLGCCGWNTQLVTTTTTSSTMSPIGSDAPLSTTTTTQTVTSTVGPTASWVDASTATARPTSNPNTTASAEDESHRNIILIVVFSCAVGLAMIFMLAVYIHRRRRLVLGDSRIRQSDSPYVPSPASSESLPDDGIVHSAKSSIKDPFDFLIKAEQNKAKEKQRAMEFRQRQETLREKRDRSRGTAKASPVRESFNDEMTVPILPEEIAVLKILTDTIEENEEIKRIIYNDLLLKWHPDKRRDDPKLSTQVFQYIQSRKKWYLHASNSKTH